MNNKQVIQRRFGLLLSATLLLGSTGTALSMLSGMQWLMLVGGTGIEIQTYQQALELKENLPRIVHEIQQTRTLTEEEKNNIRLQLHAIEKIIKKGPTGIAVNAGKNVTIMAATNVVSNVIVNRYTNEHTPWWQKIILNSVVRNIASWGTHKLVNWVAGSETINQPNTISHELKNVTGNIIKGSLSGFVTQGIDAGTNTILQKTIGTQDTWWKKGIGYGTSAVSTIASIGTSIGIDSLVNSAFNTSLQPTVPPQKKVSPPVKRHMPINPQQGQNVREEQIRKAIQEGRRPGFG